MKIKYKGEYMLKDFIYFGEEVEGYDRPVVNEREARAGAGILLLPALLSFLNAYTTHSFLFTQIFITVFMVDFFIRVLINPKFAPSLILGRIFVQNQIPEYVSASQKRFAWSLGLGLSVIMFILVIILELMTPIKIAICLLCIALLFSETAFGICLGCILYNKFFNKDAKYCPGGTCEVREKEKIQQVSKAQWLILIGAIVGVVALSYGFSNMDKKAPMGMNCGSEMKCGSGKWGGGK